MPQLIVLHSAADAAIAAEVLRALADQRPILLEVSPQSDSAMDIGGSLPVLCIWSSAAASQGLGPAMARLLARDPARSVVWRLDDAPDFGGPAAKIGPGAWEQVRPQIVSSLKIARSEIANRPGAVAARGGAGMVPVLIGTAILAAFVAAGASAYLMAPTERKIGPAAAAPVQTETVQPTAGAEQSAAPPESGGGALRGTDGSVGIAQGEAPKSEPPAQQSGPPKAATAPVAEPKAAPPPPVTKQGEGSGLPPTTELPPETPPAQ